MGYEALAINGFVAAVFVLGFVQGAYSTEVLRGAIEAIPIGQLEAARAYGMSSFLEFRRVTLPAMLPFALPGLANLWLIVTKDTALIAVVGYTELALTTRQAAGNTKMYLTFFLVAGAIYLAITLVSQQIFGCHRAPDAARPAQALLRTGMNLHIAKIIVKSVVLGGLGILAIALIYWLFFVSEWSWLPKYLPLLLKGLWITIQLLVLSSFFGMLLAIPIGLVQVTGPSWLAFIARWFCTIIRGTPLLIQLWLIYYGLGSLFPQIGAAYPGFRENFMWLIRLDSFYYALFAFTISFAGYEGEIMRGAFLGVPRGELEAARAYGMSPWKVLTRVWFPRAVRLVLPTLAGELVLQLKSTPVAFTVAVMDLMGVTTKIRQDTFRIFEPLMLLAVIYMCLTFVIVWAFGFLERMVPQKR